MIYWIDKTVKVIIIILLVGLIFVVSLQVFARFLLPRAPSWTEEMARFLLLFLVAFSTGKTYSSKMFVNVDILLQGEINRNFYVILKILINLIVCFSMVIVGVFSIPMINVGFRQTSSVLLIPMVFIFLVMLIIPTSILLAQIYQFYQFLVLKREKIK